MIQPPGIDNGTFVVSPDSVWYARVLLLFTATSQTNTGSKTFDCALINVIIVIIVIIIYVIIEIIVIIYIIAVIVLILVY